MMVTINIANIAQKPVLPGNYTPKGLPKRSSVPQTLERAKINTEVFKEFNLPGENKDKIDFEDLKKETKDLNKLMKKLGQHFRFGVYGSSQQFYVNIVDVRTDSVVKTLPYEKLLDLRERIEQAVGLIIDEEV